MIDLSASLTDLMVMQPKRRQKIKSSAKAGKTQRQNVVSFSHRKLVHGFKQLPGISVDSARLLEQDR